MYTKPNLTPRVTRLALIATGLSTLAAHSAVTLSHYYSLGEDGSTPLDSIAGADFSGTTGSSPSVIAGSANGSIGSSSYLSYSGGSYSFGADVQSSMPTNNFAVGLWVRTSTINPTRTDSVIFQGNQNGGGDADLILSDGGSGATDAWAASVSGAHG
ncbi:hypothetical protein Rhal01_02084 [Rubritalea halochordaticola]|uniref:PEP-CTERM sorting domain-containing protein n=1 Tax=Rubritalea halochordaticola TaxID=714537 RepID=A0ABP9UZN7_9BACT